MSPALALDGHHRLTLRSYQTETIAASEAAEARGCRKQLWVLPTGTGKTVCFVALAAKRGDRTLIIAHRDELIGQAAAKARQWWPDADIGIVKAERNEVWAQDIIVASVQSLSPARCARLGHFGLVIVDEAHHSRSASYTRVLSSLRAGEADGPLLVGVTATPDRADGLGLDSHFSEIVVSYDILWAIREGFLVDLRCKEVKIANLRLEDVKVSRGDYAEGQLGRAMSEANAPWHIVKAWKELAAGRLTASFHPTIVAAQEQAQEFNAQGVPAACVSGVDLDERRRILRALEAGRLKVVTNAAVLTEGWDFPALSCIIQARPTKSRGLYVQIVGRSLRPYPGKDDALILDVTGSSERMDLCSVPSLFGVDKKKVVSQNRTVTEAIDETAREAELAARKPQPRTTGDVVTRDVDLFKPTAGRVKRLTWRKRRGVFSADAAGMTLVMEPMGGDRYRVSTVVDKVSSVLMEGVPLALAQGIAEQHARGSNGAGKPTMHNPQGAPTDKQLAFAQRLGLSIPPGTTKGDLSRRIDAELAARKTRR